MDRTGSQVTEGGPPEPGAPPETAWVEVVTPGRFAGQTVIVTGAASGIGRATATRVAREGGRVVAVDVSAERLEALVTELGEAVVPVVADITNDDDVARVVAAAEGRVHALANVAGIMDDFAPVAEVSDAMWDRVLAVNLTGPFRLMRAVIPGMVAAGGGTIVNVTSEAGLRGGAAGTAYTASKHALIGLTRSAATMYGPDGVRTNAVAPGGVATGMAIPGVNAAGMARLHPVHATAPAPAQPEALAASIAFLLSADSVNLNGAILPSDGGWSAS
ncbi:SDR family NAD(P)-dependent oxidoreductase [Salana multivorans]